METLSSFSQVIQDHLALKERNSRLEGEKPLDNYKTEDPFENHPLFKTEEQARIEEPAISHDEAALVPDTWPTEESVQQEEGLWTRSRDFDWGD